MFEEFREKKLIEIGKDYKFIIEHILPDIFVKQPNSNEVYIKSVFMKKDKTRKYKLLKKLDLIIEDSGRIYLTDKSYRMIIDTFQSESKETNLTNFLANLINKSINKELFLRILDTCEY